MTTTKTKSVEWSYPSSPNAQRFGFPNGCWTVRLYNAHARPQFSTAAGFSTIEEARAFADTLPEPYDSNTK